MKRLVIGDIHGHWETLEKIYWKENPNEVIILGDYFDNFGGDDESIIECFDNILTLQKIHNDAGKGKFILLLGNHDYHYVAYEQYSGYRRSYSYIANDKINKAIKLGYIQIAYIDNINKTIYSHAGITNTWLDDHNYVLEDINNINLDSLRFTYKGGGDVYGNTIYASPIWIRPKSLLIDMYEDNDKYIWHQIVGHTHTKEPHWYITEDENNNKKLLVLDSMPSYYLIETLDDNNKIINREIIKNN